MTGGLTPVERRKRLASLLVNLGKGADSRQIVGCHAQGGAQFGLSFVELARGGQRTPECHTRRHVGRVALQAGSADPNSLGVVAGAAVLLRQLGEGKRRRVGLDSAS